MAQGQQVALQVAVIVVVETWVVVLVIVMMIIPCMRMSGLLHLNLWLVTN